MALKKITDSARGESCTVRLPGICNYDNNTVIFAHINGVRYGHGIGIKTQLGAYACSSCHDVLDGRTKRPDGMETDYLKLAHYEGVMETMTLMINSGVLK